MECAFHTILCVRRVYPANAFVRRRLYDTPVYESRHPGLSEYIHSVVRAIAHELEESTVRQVILAIYHEDAPDEALEEFVFVLTFLLSDADKRDRDLVIRGNISRATAELVARQFLLQILTCESRLEPMASDRPRTFRILLDVAEGCAPSGGIDEPTFGAWVPASGIPFKANAQDDGIATVSTTAHNSVESMPLIHPLHILESGIIHMALHVEESRERKEYTKAYVPSAFTSSQHSSTPAASLPRDLDDPTMDEYDPSQVPVRKRKLYAQVQGGNGPMSDDSSESFSSDGGHSDTN